jgi:hypothetical protein
MYKKIYVWNFQDKNGTDHIVCLDNLNEKGLVTVDNTPLDKIFIKNHFGFNFEYQFEVEGSKCSIVVKYNLFGIVPSFRLSVDGVYTDTKLRHYALKKPPIYSIVLYIMSIIAIFGTAVTHFGKYMSAFMIFAIVVSCIIRYCSNLPIPTIQLGIPKFMAHIIRFIILASLLTVSLLFVFLGWKI